MTSTPIPELVRGNVKAAMKEAGASSADLWNVAPSMLRVLPGLNGRIMTPEYKAHIESTAQSIMENGSKAASQLKSGLAAAKKDGKTKVTAKHLGEKKALVTDRRPGLDAIASGLSAMNRAWTKGEVEGRAKELYEFLFNGGTLPLDNGDAITLVKIAMPSTGQGDAL